MGICKSLVFRHISTWLVKAERVGAGPSQNGRSQFLRFFDRGGVILHGTELVVTTILSFTSGGFHISMKNSYPASAGTSVLVCGQRMVILTFLKEDYYV